MVTLDQVILAELLAELFDKLRVMFYHLLELSAFPFPFVDHICHLLPVFEFELLLELCEQSPLGIPRVSLECTQPLSYLLSPRSDALSAALSCLYRSFRPKR